MHFDFDFLLDTLRQLRPGELTGEKIQSFTLAPTADYLTETKWDATRLELLPGRVFLDSPEFYASALEVLIDTLWPRLAGREVTSFGRTPLDLPDLHTGLETLPFYRARLADLERAIGDRVLRGVGIHESTVRASLMAILSAVNRAERDAEAAAA